MSKTQATFEKDIEGPDYRKKCLRQKLQSCAVCGYSKYTWSLLVHHIDGNRDNNKLSNLIPVCNSCHVKIHNTCEYDGRIGEFDERLNSEVVEIPENVVEQAREVRDNSDCTCIGEAIRHMAQEGGYDV